MSGVVLASAALADGAPVMMLIQVKGDVQFSKNGSEWKKLDRNKLLFAGVQVKTGADGSGLLINQVDGTQNTLGGDTVVKVTDKGAEALSGSGLSAPGKADGTLLSGVNNRFTQAQRYTTVRRSVKKDAGSEEAKEDGEGKEGETKGKGPKIHTAKELTAGPSFSELVWENPGPEYSYELVIDGQSQTIAGSQGPMVRHRVSGLSAGSHNYLVILKKGDAVVFKPRKPGTLHWLDDARDQAIQAELKSLESAAPGDQFLAGSLLESKQLIVAAMDRYQKHLEQHPDDNELRPFLVKTYHDLKLMALKKAAAAEYLQKMEVK
ncbi:MAG: hypothetical protein HQL82_12215 [Magnetococcales bacterium]|nr:hypothetical protein [Magnetococcales bacterium]